MRDVRSFNVGRLCGRRQMQQMRKINMHAGSTRREKERVRREKERGEGILEEGVAHIRLHAARRRGCGKRRRASAAELAGGRGHSPITTPLYQDGVGRSDKRGWNSSSGIWVSGKRIDDASEHL
jgi:hypothetical protein